jgi:hypothetical protein
MATLQTSLADYLRTSYRPDCDYVDGEVQERNGGEFDHAAVQAFLTSCFFSIATIGICRFYLRSEFGFRNGGSALLMFA